MLPVTVCALGKLTPSFHEQHTRVADVTCTTLSASAKTAGEFRLVAFARREARARRLGTADAAATGTAIDLGFVKTEHFCLRIRLCLCDDDQKPAIDKRIKY